LTSRAAVVRMLATPLTKAVPRLVGSGMYALYPLKILAMLYNTELFKLVYWPNPKVWTGQERLLWSLRF
jgi:hypothetical protein